MSRHRLRRTLYLALTAAGAFGVSALFLLVAGKDPFRAIAIIVEQSLLSRDGFYETLARSIPLALAGLGIAIAFRASVYNIGGDGQLIAGAIVATAAVIGLDVGGLIALPLLLAAALAGGAALGGFAGWLKARFDANEIIVTILLNFIAVQLLVWVTRGPLQESARIFPRSNPLPEAARLPALVENTQLHAGLIVTAVAVAAVYWLMRLSVFGYQLIAVGENRAAAAYGGMATRRVIVLALALSGALCGLAGGVEVAGIFHRLEENFAVGVGITAIAVALLAQLNPLLVPLTAFLFGVLTVGAGTLQRQLGVPFPLIWIIDAIVIIAFLLASSQSRWSPRRAASGATRG